MIREILILYKWLGIFANYYTLLEEQKYPLPIHFPYIITLDDFVKGYNWQNVDFVQVNGYFCKLLYVVGRKST